MNEPQGGFSQALAQQTSLSASKPRLVGMPPREAVGHLKRLLTDESPVVVLDAGTGILSGALTRARLKVIAAEAESDPVAQLRRSLPMVPAIRCRRGILPFATGSLAAVLFGLDSFGVDSRSVDSRSADNIVPSTVGVLDEFARVLVSGGQLIGLGSEQGSAQGSGSRSRQLQGWAIPEELSGSFRFVEERHFAAPSNSGSVTVSVWMALG